MSCTFATCSTRRSKARLVRRRRGEGWSAQFDGGAAGRPAASRPTEAETWRAGGFSGVFLWSEEPFPGGFFGGFAETWEKSPVSMQILVLVGVRSAVLTADLWQWQRWGMLS